MTPIELQLKSLGNELEFMPESFRQNASVPFGVCEFSPQGVGRCSNELLDLCERFLVHDLLEKIGEV